MKLKVDKLGEQLILEREAMYENLGLNLMKVCERGGTTDEREEHRALVGEEENRLSFAVGFGGGTRVQLPIIEIEKSG